MSKRLYVKPDGTVREEILAEREAAAAARDRDLDLELVESLLGEVNENGYVIIPELISGKTIAEIKAATLPLLEHNGRNEFEGFKTRRIYSVIEKTLTCNPLVEHPLILALLDRLLMENYLLSQLQVINIHPGEIRQPLHHDDAFYPIPRPRKPFSAATIWALDDFTEDNGATLMIPRSHLWGNGQPDADSPELTPAVMPAGSVIFFVGTLWHGAGANNTDQTRMAATAQYCEPWARQQENYSLAISKERAQLCSKRLQAMLGYSMLFPFIGFVDGRNPVRLLEKNAPTETDTDK